MKDFITKLKKLWESMLDGEILFTLRIHKAFPSIIAIFLVMMTIIYIRYRTDHALAEYERANYELESARINYETKQVEYIGLIKASTIETLAKENGLNLKTPTQPVRVIK